MVFQNFFVRVQVSLQGPCGPRILKKASFFYVRMRVNKDQTVINISISNLTSYGPDRI